MTTKTDIDAETKAAFLDAVKAAYARREALFSTDYTREEMLSANAAITKATEELNAVCR